MGKIENIENQETYEKRPKSHQHSKNKLYCCMRSNLTTRVNTRYMKQTCCYKDCKCKSVLFGEGKEFFWLNERMQYFDTVSKKFISKKILTLHHLKGI